MNRDLYNINAIKLYHINVAAQSVSTPLNPRRVECEKTTAIRDFRIIWEIMLITSLNVQCKIHSVDVTSFDIKIFKQ